MSLEERVPEFRLVVSISQSGHSPISTPRGFRELDRKHGLNGRRRRGRCVFGRSLVSAA